jgi:hypothetical protein
VLHFRWRLADQEAEGVDMTCFDANGLIEDYTVMVKPLSAVVALRDAVWSQIEAGSHRSRSLVTTEYEATTAARAGSPALMCS